MPVGDSKTPGNVEYHERAPVMKYWQHEKSKVIFSGITSVFVASCESVAEHAIITKIEEYLNLTETSSSTRT